MQIKIVIQAETIEDAITSINKIKEEYQGEVDNLLIDVIIQSHQTFQ